MIFKLEQVITNKYLVLILVLYVIPSTPVRGLMNMRPCKFLATNLSVRKHLFTGKQIGSRIGYALFLW